MPVRFLGGGGGGSTDVRTIIAAPTLTTVTATTETPTCVWAIPANYLLAKDGIFISLVGTTTLATTTNKPIYRVRMGTTGTTADTLLFTTMLDATALYTALTNKQSVLENLIYIPSIGSTGSCLSCGKVLNTYATSDIFTQLTANNGTQQTNKTIDTTAILYISISVFFATTGNTFTPEVPFISFSL